MNLFKLASLAAFAAILTACAHPISMAPRADKLSSINTESRINKSVAYIITSDMLAKEVTTPGGGGDKVSYLPYRDIESAFYTVLSKVFSNVNKLKSASDIDSINKYDISLIITPDIVTNSSSSSPFTWPPTKFSTELSCKITDKTGKLIWETKVTGEGAAEFDEFKKDFSLSARRSTEDALLKLQKSLLAAPELRN